MRIIEAGGGDGIPTGREAFERWVGDERTELRRRLAEEGAILLRGFLSGEPEAFQGFIDALGAPPMRYQGGVTPRSQVRSSVYTSTDAPSFLPIPLHNEMSYSDRYPAVLAFCCQEPPRRGGRTPLADTRAVWRELAAEVRDPLEREGLRYEQTLPESSRRTKSWPEMFETSDRGEVDHLCDELDIEATWRNDGSLRIVRTRPASVAHPLTGDRVWFNQINVYHPSFSAELGHAGRPLLAALLRGLERLPGDLAPSHPIEVRFGDGTPVPREVVDGARATLWRHEVSFPWRRGDLLLVDNLASAHARQPFRGSRSILAALFEEWA